MNAQESLLDTLFDDETLEDDQEVKMLDVEEGELVEHFSKTGVGECSNVGDIQEKQEFKRHNSRQKKKKKRNKRKKGGCTGPNVTDINRFVLDACKHLKERKSYLMYTAVGCLGVAALDDLIKEVDAIQARGGQKTADGRRFRYGGGILWSIVKVRDPNAYKEIMAKGRDFEKQFKQQKRKPLQHTASLDHNQFNSIPSDLTPHNQSQHNISTAGEKRASVHSRIRMPVTYDDDLLGGEGVKDNSAGLK